MQRETAPFDYQWKALAVTLAALFSVLIIYTAFQLINPIGGEWRGSLHDDRICITFERGGLLEEVSLEQACFSWDEYSVLPIYRRGTFELTRRYGKIRLSGAFAAGAGQGTFEFVPNPEATGNSCRSYSDEALFRLFLREPGFGDTTQACRRHCRTRAVENVF